MSVAQMHGLAHAELTRSDGTLGSRTSSTPEAAASNRASTPRESAQETGDTPLVNPATPASAEVHTPRTTPDPPSSTMRVSSTTASPEPAPSHPSRHTSSAHPPTSEDEMDLPLTKIPLWSLGPQHRPYVHHAAPYLVDVPGGPEWDNLLASYITFESLASSQPVSLFLL